MFLARSQTTSWTRDLLWWSPAGYAYVQGHFYNRRVLAKWIHLVDQNKVFVEANGCTFQIIKPFPALRECKSKGVCFHLPLAIFLSIILTFSVGGLTAGDQRLWRTGKARKEGYVFSSLLLKPVCAQNDQATVLSLARAVVSGLIRVYGWQ